MSEKPLKLEYWRLSENLKALQDAPEKRFIKALQSKVDYIKWAMSKELSDKQKQAIEKDVELIKAAEEYFAIMHQCVSIAIREHDAAHETTALAFKDKFETDQKFYEYFQIQIGEKYAGDIQQPT